MLAKLLAIRLQKVILHLVHQNQTGFMPGKSTYNNTRCLYLHVHRAATDQKSRLVLSLDVLRAFDTINWSFLWKTMHQMGFSLHYINWVCLLYTNPRARVCTNKDISDVFSLQRGMRQGCPLLPLLFALAIEPLAQAVRQSATVGSICYGAQMKKISLYAEDTLIYLDGSEQSFVSLMGVMEEFGKVTGLRAGWEKSVAFPIDPNLDYTYLTRSKLDIQPTFKYLGIQINADLSTYESLK